MAKIRVDVLLKDGTDEAAFIADVTSNTEVDLKNRLPNSPTLVVLKVEESYLSTLRSHSSVVTAEVEPPIAPTVTYPSIPSVYTLSNKQATGWESSPGSTDGRNCISLQHYYDTDIIRSDDKIGMHHEDDEMNLAGVDYYSTYNGKHVDIVNIDAGPTLSTLASRTGHPDFDDPDNTGTSRCVPVDWTDLEAASNNQVTNSSQGMFDAHTVAVLSAAAGVYGGFAKKANLYAAYAYWESGSPVDGNVEVFDAIKGWHNSKSNNGTTGLKNPTIILTPYGWPTTVIETAIEIEDIDSVTSAALGTSNQPGGGWGSDFTPFTDRNIIPVELYDKATSQWKWCITFPTQTINASFSTACAQAWDAGIVVINASGNWCGTYTGDDSAEFNGTYCSTSGTVTKYSVDFNANEITKGTTGITSHYNLRNYGFAGNPKCISVAAAANSESQPLLDPYSGRGPGVDIVGRGLYTFTAGDESNSTYSDGNKWQQFGGVSCAIPTVGGKAACMMEEYYVLNGAWPTPDQVKNMLIAESRPTLVSVATTNWSNVTGINTNIMPQGSMYARESPHNDLRPHLLVYDTHGGVINPYFTDLAGTPNRVAFWNTKSFNREHTYKERPTSGVLYPRPRKFDYPPPER